MQAERAELERRTAELAELFAGGVIDVAALTAGTGKARERPAELEVQLDAAAAALAPEVAAASFAASFAQLTELPLGQRRQMVSAVFEDIEVTGRGKGNYRLHSGLVRYKPRGGDWCVGAGVDLGRGLEALQGLTQGFPRALRVV